jgi:hypothetical protein
MEINIKNKENISMDPDIAEILFAATHTFRKSFFDYFKFALIFYQ